MYRQFYGLSGAVFDKALPPDKFYRGKAFTEALARLEYSVSTRDMMCLVGDIGTGKTSVVRALRERLEGGKHKFAYVGNPTLKARGVLSTAAYQLGLDVGWSLPRILRDLTRHLVDLRQRAVTPVVVFDEIQLADFAMTEALRMLVSHELDSQTLVSILLVGHESFLDRLKLSAYQSLNQRIGVRYRLRPLDLPETLAYIEHHLKVAGAHHRLFEDEALEQIYQASKGVARKVNLLCTHALLAGAAEERKLIGPAVIKRVLNDFDGTF
jgi:type II secretory pathway predicted ATPase ExeA